MCAVEIKTRGKRSFRPLDLVESIDLDNPEIILVCHLYGGAEFKGVILQGELSRLGHKVQRKNNDYRLTDKIVILKNIFD